MSPVSMVGSPTDPPATLQIWSPDLHSSNITSTSLFPVGSTFIVGLNVTNAGALGGFDITLNYGLGGVASSTVPIVVDSATLAGGLFDPSQHFADPNCSILTARGDVIPVLNRIRFAAAVVGGCTVAGTGRLLIMNFHVVAVGATSIDLIQGADSGGNQKLSIVSGTSDHSLVQLQVYNAYFRNKVGIPPIAGFTYAPANPLAGQTVGFNTNSSLTYDPDVSAGLRPGIKQYIWSWGDNLPLSQGNSLTNPTHIFKFSPTVPATGTFEVKLIVIDTDDGLPSETFQLVTVNAPVVRNLAVSISADKNQLNVGDTIKVTVTAYNRGNQNENANLTVWYDLGAGTLLGQNSSFPLVVSSNRAFEYSVQTSNLTPRAYTIYAQIVLLGHADENPIDNLATYSFTLIGSNQQTVGLSVPLLAGGVVAALAAIGSGVFFVRRRRKDEDTLEQ